MVRVDKLFVELTANPCWLLSSMEVFSELILIAIVRTVSGK